MRHLFLFATLALGNACSHVIPGPQDAGLVGDGGGLDAEPLDAGPTGDAGPLDAGPTGDAGPLDAGPTGDAGPPAAVALRGGFVAGAASGSAGGLTLRGAFDWTAGLSGSAGGVALRGHLR